MTTIRRKKKLPSSDRNAILAKLFLSVAFLWSMFVLFGSGSHAPEIIHDFKEKSSFAGSKGSDESANVVAGAGKGDVGGVRGAGAKVEKSGSNDNAVPILDKGHVTSDKEETISKDAFDFEEEYEAEDEKIKPLKPLRQTNVDIISTAPMVDLTFVDAADNYDEDPHRGATDENGEFGYVHDEKALKRNPPGFSSSKTDVHCDNHDNNYKVLTEKVFVDLQSHQKREREAEQDGGRPREKIFCTVYTIEKNHDKIQPIRETWGQRCDGFMVASDKTDKDLGTVNIPHEGPEEYHNIWQKVRSIWSYVYDNYYDEYDWFHIGGDDLYILVENLRLYLESEEVQLAANGGTYLPNGKEKEQIPLFLGRRFAEQGNYERIFNSGGSGYTLNKAALKSLVVTAFPVCMPHLKTFAEDVMVAQCLRNKIKVFPFDTKDDEGGERYMPFQPGHHLTYRAPADKKSDWYANYSINIKFGLDHMSAQSVAFHYIKPPLMKRMHAILYGHCA
mmetsp:Transcript_22601/g.28520  ORF Transcript_22601/g.28520 Transcript_22601/m.28520 type:complete len:503 (+) Transcript_22601:104-1612(+)|eukprot:CAMPEP_0203663936 /NCGR_PEP_ID=MMETSP0090-20130426/1430_1 /ASSEMBLY_ACC=CAM_ASM_001088 /TAXON_ID=426623 /ORGANISM="Chaetoceros affinis, Strain CCMP159" /LENGTH=502 /DNA_ID=CAMNT_0050526993 /DNA_START=95 /DNA_END=1603 /DNA_ORIENTATION=-